MELKEAAHRPSKPAWTPWRPIKPAVGFTACSLAETLDGGQAFRWRCDDGVWTGQWSDVVVRVRLRTDGALEWSAPDVLAKRVSTSLPGYFATGRDFASLTDALPWRSDHRLAIAIQALTGLRILRQPLDETLLAFLCSPTKQIVQIKQILALLAKRFGAEILPGMHALPTWPVLAEVSEPELRACSLGFRARHIKAAAVALSETPDWSNRVECLPYPEAREWLMRLPGVGEKIADCVLLFGMGKLESFPVDVWILKVMCRRYGLEGWKNSWIAHFGRVHFGPAAGLAQQYLFALERRNGRQ